MNEEVKNDNVVTEETTLVNNEESKVVEEEKNETPEVEVVPTEQEKKPETLFSKILAWTKRILSWLGTGILAILLIIVGWLTIDKYIVGNPVPSFLGYSFLSIGVMLCVGILTMPYNKNKLDLFDNAALKGNTGSKKITFIRIIFFTLLYYVLIPMLEDSSDILYLIYFVIGLILTLLTPLWIRIAVKKIIKNKYKIIDSL